MTGAISSTPQVRREAIEAKRPSIFALNNTMEMLLAHCDSFPHREEILQMLEVGADKIKKGLT